VFTYEKKFLGKDILIDGEITHPNLDDIYNDIVDRRHEIYPGCLEVDKDSDFDYITTDWNTYHDYVCMEKFVELKFLFPYIAESLEIVGDDFKDYYFKSWINIWPRNQSIGIHRHYGIWHGYYVIKDTGTKTYYFPTGSDRATALINFDGHYVFMPAKIMHFAMPNPSNQLRVSMGFNISDWDEVLREEKENSHGRGPKIRNVVIPLKDYI
jgi:hypothetical protein